jgi:hypothetical protein
MSPHRNRTHLRGTLIALVLVLGSLLGFRLGQEARVVVSSWPQSGLLSDVASREAAGALGVPIPPLPVAKAHRARKVAAAPSGSTASRPSRDEDPDGLDPPLARFPSIDDVLHQCSSGYSSWIQERLAFMTPAGGVFSGQVICQTVGPTSVITVWWQVSSAPGFAAGVGPTPDDVADSGAMPDYFECDRCHRSLPRP